MGLALAAFRGKKLTQQQRKEGLADLRDHNHRTRSQSQEDPDYTPPTALTPTDPNVPSTAAPPTKRIRKRDRTKEKSYRYSKVSKTTGRRIEPYLKWKPSWVVKREKAQEKKAQQRRADPLNDQVAPKKHRVEKKRRRTKKKKGRPTDLLKHVKGMTCPICQEVLVGSMTLGCGHNFCQECMVRMLVYKTADVMKVGVVNCPLCNTSIAQHPAVNQQLDRTIATLVKVAKNSQLSAAYEDRLEELKEFREEELAGLKQRLVKYCHTFINESYNNPVKAWPYVTRHLPWFSWMHTAVLDLQS